LLPKKVEQKIKIHAEKIAWKTSKSNSKERRRLRKRMRIAGFNPQMQGETAPEADLFEQIAAKRREQARKAISSRYAPAGDPHGREFRTTLELQYEFREMFFLSESAIIDAMIESGFEIVPLEGKPNWVLYPLLPDTRD
jgi:hypothetical protein